MAEISLLNIFILFRWFLRNCFLYSSTGDLPDFIIFSNTSILTTCNVRAELSFVRYGVISLHHKVKKSVISIVNFFRLILHFFVSRFCQNWQFVAISVLLLSICNKYAAINICPLTDQT